MSAFENKKTYMSKLIYSKFKWLLPISYFITHDNMQNIYLECCIVLITFLFPTTSCEQEDTHWVNLQTILPWIMQQEWLLWSHGLTMRLGQSWALWLWHMTQASPPSPPLPPLLFRWCLFCCPHVEITGCLVGWTAYVLNHIIFTW